MQRRLVASAIALVSVAGVAGCGAQQTAPPKASQVTFNDATRTMNTSCQQVQWMLTIDMNAAPTHIRAYLRLDGDQPSPEIVEIQNLDHFYGVTRKGAGDTEARFANGTYTITGTVEGSTPNDVANPTTKPFKIETHC